MNGTINVICGPMSSGKSLELIRILERYSKANKKIVTFKSTLDTRDKSSIMSRNGMTYNKSVFVVGHSSEILDIVKYTTPDIIAIDEAQFLDETIIKVINLLANQEIDIFISGLEKDSSGNVFGPMGELLAISDNVIKLTAICSKCFCDNATMTYRKDNKETKQLLVGGDEIYEPRCRKCWKKN